jgi:hypothetical protein
LAPLNWSRTATQSLHAAIIQAQNKVESRPDPLSPRSPAPSSPLQTAPATAPQARGHRPPPLLLPVNVCITDALLVLRCGVHIVPSPRASHTLEFVSPSHPRKHSSSWWRSICNALVSWLLLRMGTGRALKTIEAPPTMVMLVPSDLSSTQLLVLSLQCPGHAYVMPQCTDFVRCR